MKKALFLLLFVAFAATAPAAPEITSLTLRSGSALPRYNGEIVRANYSINNPDDTAADLSVQIFPDGASGGAFYYRDLILPPHSSINGFIPIVFSSASRYLYKLIQHTSKGDVEIMHGDLYLSGNRPANQPPPASELESFSYPATDYMLIAVLHNPQNASQAELPNLTKSRELDNLARFVKYGENSSFHAPANLAEYQDISAILALEDQYDAYTPLQFNAIRDFVRKGGLLIVGGAWPTQGLYRSPLRPLLPVIPMGVRRMEDGNALRKAWGFPAREYQWRDDNGDLLTVQGFDFQEVVMAEDATVLADLDGLPMMALRQYGLGMVLWLAFDPMEFCHNEPETRFAVWNSLMRHATFVPRSRRADSQLLLEGIQQQLLGYSIPPFRTLGHYLLAYVIGAAILLLVCIRLHHPAIGWGLVCLFGLVMTLVIVFHAHNLSANQPQRQINSISLAVWDGAPGPCVEHANLASRSDTSLSMGLDGGVGFLFPQPPKPSMESLETALEQNRLLINASANAVGLPHFSLQENRPRAVNWHLASHELETPPQAELPILEVANDGTCRLAEWSVPETLRPFNRALLMLPGAIHTLANTETKLAGIAGDAVENDTVLVQIREYLATRLLRVPAVCLVSIRRLSAVKEKLEIQCEDGEFGSYEYRLTLIPVRISWPAEGDTFTVPADLTWMALDMNSALSRFWEFGKCSGIPLSAAAHPDQESQRYNSHHRIPVNVEFPPTIPAGTLCGADIRYDLIENSSATDIQIRLFDRATDQVIEPLSETPKNSLFGEAAAQACDPGHARLTVTFIPVTTSAAADGQDGPLSNREQIWWLDQVQASLVFRRPSAPSAQ